MSGHCKIPALTAGMTRFLASSFLRKQESIIKEGLLIVLESRNSIRSRLPFAC
jgi:hypothetical protein